MSTDKTPNPEPLRGEEILRLIQRESQRLLGPNVEVRLNLGNQTPTPDGPITTKFFFVNPRRNTEAKPE